MGDSPVGRDQIKKISDALKKIPNLKKWCMEEHGFTLAQYTHANQIKNGARTKLHYQTVQKFNALLFPEKTELSEKMQTIHHEELFPESDLLIRIFSCLSDADQKTLIAAAKRLADKEKE
jgi:hypothetical protein